MTKDSLQQGIEDLRIAMSDISPALEMYRRLKAQKERLEQQLEELKNE